MSAGGRLQVPRLLSEDTPRGHQGHAPAPAPAASCAGRRGVSNQDSVRDLPRG